MATAAAIAAAAAAAATTLAAIWAHFRAARVRATRIVSARAGAPQPLRRPPRPLRLPLQVPLMIIDVAASLAHL